MLLAPLRYWKIHHPVKRRWDGILPAASSIALTALLFAWPGVRSPFADAGYLAGLQSLLAMLGGFFVAALTLLSTAETEALSQPLSGSPPVTFGTETAPLGRRRFLCLLFGYLSFSCFALYAAGFLAVLLAPGMESFLSARPRSIAAVGFLLVYNFWLSHMFISTLVGLYYFTDRLQRPDPEIIRDPSPIPAE
jgi:hypothetical protein